MRMAPTLSRVSRFAKGLASDGWRPISLFMPNPLPIDVDRDQLVAMCREALAHFDHKLPLTTALMARSGDTGHDNLLEVSRRVVALHLGLRYFNTSALRQDIAQELPHQVPTSLRNADDEFGLLLTNYLASSGLNTANLERLPDNARFEVMAMVDAIRSVLVAGGDTPAPLRIGHAEHEHLIMATRNRGRMLQNLLPDEFKVSAGR